MKHFFIGVVCALMAIGGVYGQDGVKNLLLTPVEKISAVHCSDEQFLNSYATAIRADLQHFLASNQQEISKEKADSISSNVEFFIRSACNAYNLSLAWFNKYVTENEEYRYDVSFRNMLRSRLLLDLYLLHDIQCPWCSGFTAPPEIAPHSLSPAEQRFIKNLQGAVSYDQDILISILSSHTERIMAQRNMLCKLLKKVGTSSILINRYHMDMENEPVILAENGSFEPVEKEDTVEFLAAEGAWDAYLCAICRSHSQMYQGEESETSHYLAAAVVAASQNQRLQDLINFYHKARTGEFLIHFNEFLTDESSQEHLKEIVRQSTYSQEQKILLYNKAVGVEKLLRTPVELRYPVENKQAWTDEDFFAHYANALHEEMDAFIDEELRSAIYLEDYGKEQSDKDAAACKRCVDEMVSCARAAYLASLEWYTEEAKLYREWEDPDKSELISGFRIELQNRLLADITTMLQNEGNRWLHSTGCSIAAEMPDSGATATEFENALTRRHWDAFSKRTVDAWLHPNNEETLEQYRQFMVRFVYNEEHKRPTEPAKQGFFPELARKLKPLILGAAQTAVPEPENRDKEIALFLKAEHAWDAYIQAMVNAHIPIVNKYFSGSGVPGWQAEFNMAMIRSQESYLLLLISIANGGYITFPKPIDFTKNEITEEASEKLNNMPD